MMAGIATAVVGGLLIVRFLDRRALTFGGSIRPTALAQVLVRMEAHFARRGPCDAVGHT
ncbi:MAG: hypothetical protein MSC30_17200 [Gaiellaceae bacterium MAG52_C11]|nr:hypothetical protein [Candidatus Gaiellasilicea maunaloa]